MRALRLRLVPAREGRAGDVPEVPEHAMARARGEPRRQGRGGGAYLRRVALRAVPARMGAAWLEGAEGVPEMQEPVLGPPPAEEGARVVRSAGRRGGENMLERASA